MQIFSKRALELISTHNIPSEQFNGLSHVTSRMVEDWIRGTRAGRSKRAEVRQLQRASALQGHATIRFAGSKLFAYAARNGLGGLMPVVLKGFSLEIRSDGKFCAFIGDGNPQIDVAINTVHGLQAVPINVGVDLTFRDLEVEVTNAFLSVLQDDGGIPLKHYKQSFFGFSELFARNIHSFVPLLSGPQVAIIGACVDRTEDQCPISLTLTFDHREFDGRDAAVFLTKLKDRLLSLAAD